jgi:uracil permease
MYDPEQPIFDVQTDSAVKPILGINEKPGTWWETIFYAWQITLVDFTPFIWAGAFVSIAGLPDTVIPIMIRTCFIAMGIGTLVQTMFGNKLPIVQGPSASVLTSMGGVTAIYGFPAMWGAAIVGGLLETLIGVSRLLGALRKFIPPVVAGSVVASIGMVAARIAVTWIFASHQAVHLVLALLAFLFAIYLKFKGKGLWSQGFILISVVTVGVLLASLVGVYDWDKVAQAPLFMMPTLFPFKNFEGYTGPPVVFIAAAIAGGFAGYIGSIFESIGDYAATCAVSGEVYRVKHINKGIAAEGVGCVVSGFLGALPVTSYTQNIGILAATGIASLHVVKVAAVMFLLYGLSPKLAMMLACIPRPVVGSVFLLSASLIMFSGIDVVISEKRNMRNSLIAGTTLGLAVMAPYYASTAGAAWVNTLHPFIKMFFNNNIFIAVITGVSLNIILNMILKEK